MSELPTFETTSAASLDERTTWLLPGDSYLIILGGGFVSTICFVMATAAKQPVLVRFAIGLVPICLAACFLFVAVVGKPPHYAADWFAKLGRSKAFGEDPRILDAKRTPAFLD